MLLQGKEFKIFISHEDIIGKTRELGSAISLDYADKNPLFLGILNGSFMFLSDLMKEVNIPCQISFLKVASYEKTVRSENIKALIGLNEEIKDRHVVIVEDIVDTGHTVSAILATLKDKKAASVNIATLLFKPEALQKEIKIKYIGYNIPQAFVVGYGLDYNGYGRNLKDLYQIAKDNNFKPY